MRINHTEVRGKTFYFVLRVPLSIQASLKTDRIRFSLKTRDPKEAKRKAAEAFIHWNSVFQQEEAKLAHSATAGQQEPSLPVSVPELSESDLVFLVKWVEADILEADEDQRISGRLADPELSPLMQYHKQKEARLLARAVAMGKTEEVAAFMRHVMRVTGVTGQPTAKQVYEFAKALKKTADARLARDEGAIIDTPSRPSPDVLHVPRLSAVLQDFCDEHEKGGTWTGKTLMENKAIYALLLRIIGDVDVSRLTYADMREVKDTLLKLPANLNKGRFQGMTIEAILKLKPEPMSVTTVNKYLIRLSTLFGWMSKHGYVEKNFAENMTVRQAKRAADQRDRFSHAQLQAMFQAIQDGRVLKRGKRKPFHYWLPLLGYFTGARVNELASLRPQDVMEADGVPCLSITQQNDGEKGTKTDSGSRLIPLHPALLVLGFLEFVKTQEGQPRLFMELPASANNGYGDRVSKWFSGQAGPESGFLFRAGVSGQVSFHSFRHTLVTLLEQAEIDPILVKRLAGHSFDDVTYGRYSKGSSVTQAREALMKAIRADVTACLEPFNTWLGKPVTG